MERLWTPRLQLAGMRTKAMSIWDDFLKSYFLGWTRPSCFKR